ncbi:MAG: PLP-dependent transferase [Fidelibacterota bacterium]|nr:MAG: PLP-dependent transferase [Candidatus Neomarinimicrobiota bacterium]
MAEDPIYTTAVHAGEDPLRNQGSLSVPVYQSAVFALPDVEQGAAITEGIQPGYSYGRKGNPTQAALEQALCELEGGTAALALSSGMAAINVTLMTLLAPGDHIIASNCLYATTHSLLTEILDPFGISVTQVDATNPENLDSALTDKTRVLLLETPANPTLELIDIPAAVQFAHPNGLKVVMDNTFATPFNQRPLDHGVDVVIHSASKYLGGHGDLIAGGIVSTKEVISQMRWHTNKILGAVIAPLTAWLVLRGIRTLPLRMERHNANALAVARYLEGHPKIKQVLYPGLPSHPQHALAQQQMSGYGGMVAFDVSEVEKGRRLVDQLRLCTLAVSLGNVETLIQHSASMTHASIPREQRLAAGISDGMIRMSVGIERAEDIIADLEQSIAQL